MTIDELKKLAKLIRRDVIEAGYRCNESAHFGGGLSIVDLLTVLYGKIMRVDPSNPSWPERDVFILSKGHGVLGYYATLKNAGFISPEIYSTFQTNGSALISHPVMNLALGIESSNGSLGQGLSFAAGIALAFKKKGLSRRLYVLLGDGECNEGSVWESVMFAAQHDLDNLVAIVDLNGFQNDGASSAVSRSYNMHDKWTAFGWSAQDVDGHDVVEIEKALISAQQTIGRPCVLIAHTTKGKGVSFMENNNDWHHNRLTESGYKQAIAELGGDCAGN